MYKILAVSLILLITACGPEAIKPNKPAWINNPEQGTVGFSSTHIRGRYYQEELAILRARERLAARYGVEVSSVQTTRERVLNEKAYITSDRQINQSIKKQTVKAHIREIWHDTSRDEIWVWVYPIN